MEMDVNENIVSTTTLVAAAGVPRARREEQMLVVRLKRLIASRTSGQVQGLVVEVVERGILLRGQCSTFYCKQLAQHAVMESTERSVINRIEVRESKLPR